MTAPALPAELASKRKLRKHRERERERERRRKLNRSAYRFFATDNRTSTAICACVNLVSDDEGGKGLGLITKAIRVRSVILTFLKKV